MATSSLIKVLDDDSEEVIATIYVHWDGGPEWLGACLAKDLEKVNLVNGLSGQPKLGEVANGMGCLFAQIVAYLKKAPGDVYMYSKDTKDIGEDYIYYVYPMAHGQVGVTVEQCGDVLFEGLAGSYPERW